MRIFQFYSTPDIFPRNNFKETSKCVLDVVERYTKASHRRKNTRSENIHIAFQAELIRRDYVANGGWETFLSYEDPEQDILIGLLRLRKCSEETFRPELKGGCSIVRELHVYGSVVPVHSRDPTKFQHQVCFLIRTL